MNISQIALQKALHLLDKGKIVNGEMSLCEAIKLAREERVFEKLVESKHLFNSYEVRDMQSVIDYYRRTLSGGK